MLILSPKCGPFPALQRLSADKREPAEWEEELRRARGHLRFCVQLALGRAKAGRGLLLEQPLTASSWAEDCLAPLYQVDEVYRIAYGMCQ